MQLTIQELGAICFCVNKAKNTLDNLNNMVLILNDKHLNERLKEVFKNVEDILDILSKTFPEKMSDIYKNHLDKLCQQIPIGDQSETRIKNSCPKCNTELEYSEKDKSEKCPKCKRVFCPVCGCLKLGDKIPNYPICQCN